MSTEFIINQVLESQTNQESASKILFDKKTVIHNSFRLLSQKQICKIRF